MRNVNVTLRCEVCQSSFHPLYRRCSERPQTVCSPKCEKIRRWGETPTNACRQCGEDISASGKRSQKFCSPPCKWVWQGVNIRGPAHPRFKGRIAYGRANRYWALLTPHHPYADSKGYVMEHRLIMERYLGRFLQPHEVVHHISANGQNNRLSNLRLMTKTEHDAHHAPALKAALKAARSAASSGRR